MSVITLTGIGAKQELNCVAGMTWDTVSKADWKARKRQLRSDKNALIELPVTKGDTSTVNVGFIDKDGLGSGRTRLSIAAWVAQSFRTGTIVAAEKVKVADTEGEDTYWFCVVRDGQVIAGTDVIADWSSVDEQVTEIMDMIGEAEIGFIGLDASRLTSNLSTDSDIESMPVLSALSRAGKKKANLLLPTDGGSTTLILAGVLVAGLLIVGGGAAWFFLAGDSDQDRAEQARLRQIAQSQNAQRDYQQLLRDTGNKAQAAATLTRLFSAYLGKLQTQLGGWTFQSVECVDQQCELTFNNSDLTDPSILREGTANVCQTLDISMAGTQGECTFDATMTMNANGELEPIDADPEDRELKLLTAEDTERFRSGLMAYARNFENASYAINAPTEVSFPAKRFLNNQPLFRQGTWAMSFPVEQLIYVNQFLDGFSALSLSSMKLSWGGKNVEINGLYFQEGDM